MIFFNKQIKNRKSKVSSLVLIREAITRAHRQRQHRKRRILIRARHEARAVNYEQVLHVPALIEFVEHGRLRIVAHARSAKLVNDPSRRGHAASGRAASA